jgi:hypothetical protein
MKTATLVVCILAVALVPVHSDVSPVRLESSASSIELAFTGQGTDPSIGAFYHFAVRNHSSHAVTGFHVYQIPESVQKTDGKYACNDSCTGTSLLGDNADPMIEAGESFDLHIPLEDAARWPTILLDAAIFDNYTYQGDEKTAARLGVQQIGNQAEFDRVKPLLDAVAADTSMSDSAKADRLHSELAALSSDVEPQMIQRFNFWFPSLADCDHEFSRSMSGAAAAAKDVVERDLEKYTTGAYSALTFAQWIDKTNQYLKRAHIGCAGCSALPAAAASASASFQTCPLSSDASAPASSKSPASNP